MPYSSPQTSRQGQARQNTTTSAVLRRSLRLHARWLAHALSHSNPLTPPGRRRIALLTLAAPPYLTLQAAHWLGFALDGLISRGDRAVEVGDALFIVGVPRSGTTYVHRLLAQADGWTTFSTWEALLAPSVSERRLWRRLFALDRAVGRPLHRLAGRLEGLLGEDFDAIHEVGLEAAEEDYLALLPAAACFLATLAFPFDEALWNLARFDRADARTRATVLHAYTRLLQKHRFAAGGEERQLLSKNAAFASWTGSLAQAFPRARFVICVREPEAALDSQLSAIEGGGRLFGTDTQEADFVHHFVECFAGYYRHLAGQALEHPQRMAVVDQEDLARRPGATLEAALKQIGQPLSPSLRRALRAEDERAAPHKHRPPQALVPADRYSQTHLQAMRRDYARLLDLRPDTLERAS